MATTTILPVKNEERSITQTINTIKDVCDNHILVIDGHSTDNTTFYAGQFDGVEIIYDVGEGKGAALRQAFDHCYPNDVVFVDADNTYEVHRIKEFVDALDKGYDVVVGRKHYTKDVKPRILGIGLYYLGDYIWKVAFKIFYGKWTADNISGYRAMSRKSIEQMELTSKFFDIETEIQVKSIILGLDEKVIDTIYDDRVGKSKFMLKNNIDTVKAFFKYMFWRHDDRYGGYTWTN